MKPPRYVITQSAGGLYEIWRGCPDDDCEIFHTRMAETRSRNEAETIVSALRSGTPVGLGS